MVITKKALQKITEEIAKIYQERNKKENCNWQQVFGRLREIIEELVLALPDSSFRRYDQYSKQFDEVIDSKKGSSSMVKEYADTDRIVGLVTNRLVSMLHYGIKPRYLTGDEGVNAKKAFRYVEPVGRGLFEFNKEKELASLSVAVTLAERAYTYAKEENSDENSIK